MSTQRALGAKSYQKLLFTQQALANPFAKVLGLDWTLGTQGTDQVGSPGSA